MAPVFLYHWAVKVKYSLWWRTCSLIMPIELEGTPRPVPSAGLFNSFGSEPSFFHKIYKATFRKHLWNNIIKSFLKFCKFKYKYKVTWFAFMPAIIIRSLSK